MLFVNKLYKIMDAVKFDIEPLVVPETAMPTLYCRISLQKIFKASSSDDELLERSQHFRKTVASGTMFSIILKFLFNV